MNSILISRKQLKHYLKKQIEKDAKIAQKEVSEEDIEKINNDIINEIHSTTYVHILQKDNNLEILESFYDLDFYMGGTSLVTFCKDYS